jgi:hypothetical protein
MTSVIALWILLAAIAVWGSVRFSMRDPHSTSWVKITFAGFLLVAFGTALASSRWLTGSYLGEGLLAHAMLFFIWPMAAVGAPLCLGSMIGTLIGMHRSRDRYQS